MIEREQLQQWLRDRGFRVRRYTSAIWDLNVARHGRGHPLRKHPHDACYRAVLGRRRFRLDYLGLVLQRKGPRRPAWRPMVRAQYSNLEIAGQRLLGLTFYRV